MREMRRKAQSMSADECEDILVRGSHGVLAVLGDEGYPYTIPLNYCYEKGHIYFHCAKVGHKLDAISKCNKVSFCVVDKNDVIAEKYTTAYSSVIAFGKIEIIDDVERAKSVLKSLGRKYAPNNSEDMLNKEIEAYFDKTGVLDLRIEHISGKKGKELMIHRKPLS